MKYVGIYLLIMNLLGFYSMFADKQKAKKKQYRTPEAVLFLYALLGGSVGSILGMTTFRHKTKHLSFQLGMPAILFLQIALFVGFVVYSA